MAYSPFSIYDFRFGKVTAKKPWLLLPDAFEHLENCYIQRGILKKRQGIQAFDRFVHRVPDATWKTGDGSTVTFTDTLANRPIREIDTITDGVETFSDNGDGTLTGDAGGSGTINYTTGALSVTFNAAPAGPAPGPAADIDLQYDYYPGHAIMGIGAHVNGNAASLIVCDTKRVAKYTTGLLEDLTGGTNIFTGSDAQFFWFENWLDKVYMTNNNDNIYEYDGTTLQAYAPTFGGVTLEAALLIFVYKGRLMFLNTTEDADVNYQRARWSDINDPDTLSVANFVDCPTSDIIVGADFYGEDLVVFFETSTWRLRYTGNAELPFKWERIPGVDGSAATMSLMTFHDRIEALGQTQLVLCDNVRTLPFDQAIPNYILDFNLNVGNYSFGIVAEELRHTYLSMTDLESDKPDRILVHDYEGNTWALWKLDCHVFGFYDIDSDDAPTWDGLLAAHGLPEDTLVDDVDIAFNDRTTQLGFPLTLMGDRDGFLFKMNVGTNDDGSAIDFEAKFPGWNPFVEQGQECDLGHIDIKYKVNGNTTIYFDLFINEEATPWVTRSLVLSGTGETSVGRVEVGCVARQHQVRMYHNAADQPVEIEEITPWMQPGGNII